MFWDLGLNRLGNQFAQTDLIIIILTNRYQRKFKKGRFVKHRFRKKNFLKSRVFWDSFLVLTLFCLVAYSLFSAVFLEIKNIEITGDLNDISKQSLENIIIKETKQPFLIFFNKNTFFSFNAKNVYQNVLGQFLEIKDVKIKKIFPNSLLIEAEPRIPEAVLCSQTSECWLCDQTGFIFKKIAEQAPQGLIVLNLDLDKKPEIGENFIEQNNLERIILAEKSIAQDQGIDIQSITLTENATFKIKTLQGWDIYLIVNNELPMALAKLKILLEKEIKQEGTQNLEYIDLRFDKTYYKYK